VSASPSSRPINTRLLTGGAVLVGLGGTLTAVGLTLGSAAVVGAARRWQQGTQMTPAQLAKHALGAAQVATTSGVDAWRGPVQVAPQPSSIDGVRTPVS
jgi:hypothetical protein